MAQLPHAERQVALLDRQAIVARQLCHRTRRAAPGQVSGRGAQDAVVTHQLAGDQVRLDVLAHPDVEVETLGDDIDQPVEHLEAHLQRRVGGHQLRNGWRHHVAPEAEAAAHPQLAARHALALGHLVEQAVQAGQDSQRPCIHLLAIGADYHPPRAAVKQAYIQRCLQHGNALAHIRGRHAQLGCGAGKAGLAHHGGEYAQVAVFDLVVH